MSGTIYGGTTLNGKFLSSCISWDNDYVYFKQPDKSMFARVEVVFNNKEDWKNNKNGELALVSYKYAESDPVINGFDDFQPIVSFPLAPLKISDIPDDPWNFLGNVEKMYGNENFNDALTILFSQTMLAFKQGVRCDKGVVKYEKAI